MIQKGPNPSQTQKDAKSSVNSNLSWGIVNYYNPQAAWIKSPYT